ncbi:MAG: Rne/Rng family ribonuclease, partial [Acidobacteriota bacterium]
MLINAQHAEQLRVAIIDGQNLEEYQVDLAQSGLCRGNIYRGVVANVQPSLNAAFVDIGLDKHGFLPVDDVLASAYHRRPGSGVKRPRIDQVLERGKPILVQVTKDGAGQKGPALTTNLAMAGRYLVFMPFDDIRGISRKVDDDVIRKKVKERLKRLDLPAGQGVIVRTNGLDQNQTTLNRDLNALLRLWKRIDAENDKGRSKEPRLLYSDQDLIVQALRDYLDNSIAEVIADTDAAYDQADSYMRAFMPRSKTELVRYTERLPLFSKYEIEQQIDRIYSRQVSLPGGGSIVIDGTEALTAIDVNSGRATKNNDHEESILRVNCEAAHEIGRQLRLRDIGGLLVVDFIDMRMRKHQRKVEQAMRNAMKNDRARHSVSRISSNGLLEINRQRIKQSLRLRTHRPCPTCGGVGSIASLEFAAMSLIGRIEARAATGYLEGVRIALHPEVADAVQNNHRHDLSNLEAEFDLSVEVIAASNLHRTEERVEWKKRTKPRSAAAMAAAVTGVTASAITDTGRRRRRGRADVAAAVDEPRATGRAANDDDTPSRGSRRGRDASSTVAHRSRGGGGRWGDGG